MAVTGSYQTTTAAYYTKSPTENGGSRRKACAKGVTI
jgi:hypothetical protein